MRKVHLVYTPCVMLLSVALGLFWTPQPNTGRNNRSGYALAQAPIKIAVPVVTAVVQNELFVENLEALGTARANESVVITPTVEERITAIYFDDGDLVEKGQILVKLDDSETRHLLAEERAALKEQKLQFERVKKLATTDSASRAQLDQAESLLGISRAREAHLEARLKNYTIRAPFSGILGIRQISIGAVVNSDTVITTLDDTSTIKLDFTVPETYLSVVKKSLNVTAKSPAYPDRNFSGTVTVISSRVDPNTRTLTVRAIIPNSDRLLKPGMLLTVNLVKSQSQVIILPEEAVVMEKRKKFAFVVTPENKVEKREIVAGRRSPGKVEIISGLSVGEQAVIQGIARVRDGSAVNVIETRKSAP